MFGFVVVSGDKGTTHRIRTKELHWAPKLSAVDFLFAFLEWLMKGARRLKKGKAGISRKTDQEKDVYTNNDLLLFQLFQRWFWEMERATTPSRGEPNSKLQSNIDGLFGHGFPGVFDKSQKDGRPMFPWKEHGAFSLSREWSHAVDFKSLWKQCQKSGMTYTIFVVRGSRKKRIGLHPWKIARTGD